MPMTLSPSQRIRFVREMRAFTQTARWGAAVVSFGSTNPVRMDREKPMYKWLTQGGEQPSVCNCWESIVVAGFNAELWDADYMRAALERVQIEEHSKLPQLTQFMQSRIPKNVSSLDRHGGSWAGFAGNIVMIGQAGEHFALAAGFGKLIEVDGKDVGETTLAAILDRPQYAGHATTIYVSDPPTLDELENPPLQRGRAT